MRRTVMLGAVLAIGGAAAVAAPKWRPGPSNGFTGRSGHGMAFDSARGVLVVFGGQDSVPDKETWELGPTGWRRGKLPPPAMKRRWGHVMVYDRARGVIVVSGGTDQYGELDDTWELDGNGWHAGPAAPAGFDGRENAGAVFDEGRGRTVLFGGGTLTGGVFGDTWLYDGLSWTPGPAAPSAMVPRHGHGMAYDRQRGMTVLFGGRAASGATLADTWEFGPSGWVPGGAAPAGLVDREGASMAYDDATQRIVVVGGWRCCITRFADTWYYAGGTWSAGPALPGAMGARASAAMAFDENLARIVLVGGAGSNAVEQWRSDAWVLDSQGWTLAPVQPPGGVAPRWLHAMTYDSARKRIVLFGGAVLWGDTWELTTGGQWIRGATAPRLLEARYGHGMVFDKALGQTVLFGGTGDSCCIYFNDTWLYDGTAWRRGPGAPPGLVPREGAPLAYDDARQRVILTMGWSGSGAVADAWELDGAGWMPAPPPAALTPRCYHSMVYDAALGKTVLFGGNAAWLSPPYMNDTWLYDGSSWTPGPTAPLGLSPRGDAAMAYDSRRGRVIVFGGSQFTADTWELVGQSWVAGPPPPLGLSARAGPAMAYDLVRRAMILFGGLDSTGWRKDVWVYGESLAPVSGGPQ